MIVKAHHTYQILPLPAVLLVALSVTVFCVWQHSGAISSKIARNVTERLVAAGYTSANIAVDGRDVILSGIVTAQNKKAIVATVRDTPGVRSVNDALNVAADLKPAFFHYVAQPDTVILRGVMPDNATISKLMSAAERLHGLKVQSHLVPDRDVAAPAWLNAAIRAIPKLYGVQLGELELTADRVVVRGAVDTAESRQSLMNAIQKMFAQTGLTVEDQLRIAIPVSSNLIVTKVGEQLALEGFLPSQKQIDKLMAVIQVVFSGHTIDNRVSAADDNSAPQWLAPVISLIPELVSIERGGIKVDDHGLILTGAVESEADKRLLVERAKYVLGDLIPIHDHLTVLEVTRPASSDIANDDTLPPVADINPDPQPADQREIEAKLAELDLSAIRFAPGSARITPFGEVVLDKVSQLLQQYDQARVEIGGHTDTIGDDRFNRALSSRRAQAVRNYLVARGIAKDRMESVGYGETRPLTDDQTPEGQARNRRIEFKIIEEIN